MRTYPTYDIFMIAQMSLAVLASVDLVAVQVNIVRQTHFAFFPGRGLRPCAYESWLKR